MSDIPLTELEPGTPIHMASEPHPTCMDGKPGDLVLIAAPRGCGLVLAAMIKRFLTETPEEARARRAADLLEELAA